MNTLYIIYTKDFYIFVSANSAYDAYNIVPESYKNNGQYETISNTNLSINTQDKLLFVLPITHAAADCLIKAEGLRLINQFKKRFCGYYSEVVELKVKSKSNNVPYLFGYDKEGDCVFKKIIHLNTEDDNKTSFTVYKGDGQITITEL